MENTRQLPGFRETFEGAIENIGLGVYAVVGGPLLWYYLPVLGLFLVYAGMHLSPAEKAPNWLQKTAIHLIGFLGIAAWAGALYETVFALLLALVAEWSLFGRMLGAAVLTILTANLAFKESDRWERANKAVTDEERAKIREHKKALAKIKTPMDKWIRVLGIIALLLFVLAIIAPALGF